MRVRAYKKEMRMMRPSNEWSTRSLLPLLFVSATTFALAGCTSSPLPEQNDDGSHRQSTGVGLAPAPVAAPGASHKLAPKIAGLSVVPGQLVVKFKSDSVG